MQAAAKNDNSRLEARKAMEKIAANEEIDSHSSDENMKGIQEEETKRINAYPINMRAIDLSKATTQHFDNKEFSNVLVIVTGGTLCMVETKNGYAPIRGLASRLKNYTTFYDREKSVSEGVGEDTLITPLSHFKTRIKFTILEFENLIDSSCITLDDQKKIASTIHENYRNYDGFVVVHGTDTMAYTASTLSFMLENLNKTVVITGS